MSLISNQSFQSNRNIYFNKTSLAGLICAIAYAYLSSRSQTYAQAQLFDLYLASGVACIASLSAWLYCHYRGEAIHLCTVIFWAIIFRIIGISGFPILEDDFYRYLWDGYQFVDSGSPYTFPPSHFFANENIPHSFEAILDGINYPNIVTIYGPLCQWLFALSYLISPGEIWPLQLILSILDILLIVLLSRVAQAKYILLYAWNPLVIKEIAFTAHPDILGIFFIFAAIIILRKNIYLAAICCALAVCSKVFALILVPLVLRWHWRAWTLFIVVSAFVSVPFLNDLVAMTQGLSSMAQLWLFNAPVYFIFINYISAESLKIIMLTLFSSTWCFYAWTYSRLEHANKIPRADILFGLFLFCIPALNPWYLLWVLPFAVVYPSYWAWVSSVAVLLSYVIGLNITNSQLEPYQQPNWAVTLEYSLIVCALMYDIYKRKQKLRKLNVSS